MLCAMRVVIEGTHLPGRQFRSDGHPLMHVHVGVQVGREPVGLVPGDAPSASWELELRTVLLDDGSLDFRGPAVHGARGERFVYLTWGDCPLGRAGPFAMFRRAKLMLNRIDPQVLRAVAADATAVLHAVVVLTDAKGHPRCARVDPPAVSWSAR